MSAPRVLVTGAGGSLARQVVAGLAQQASTSLVLAHDVRPPAERLPGVHYETGDVRSPGLAGLVAAHRIDTVVHLASIVTPGRGSRREFEYDVDVNGTRLRAGDGASVSEGGLLDLTGVEQGEVMLFDLG